MRQEIRLGDRSVTYELTKKTVKNINIRIRADGTVSVSAPHHVTQEQIEAILLSRAGFLLRGLEKFQALDQQGFRERTYDQGDRMLYLGREFVIDLQSGPADRVSLEGDRARLTLRHPDDPAGRKKAVEDFYRRSCQTVTTRLCQQAQGVMAHLGVPMPEIRVRSMVSRWGSCKPSERRVTFAWQLMGAPLECVEYVVYHEMVHFLHPNHSRAFYACLETFVPDWKMRRKRLNAYILR